MGRRLGKYRLSRRRAIHEAPGIELQMGRDLTTNRRVTMKVFDTTITLAAGVGELIKFEVGTMSRTNWHPHVVELLDVLASPRKVFVVMETVSGGDLFEAITAEGRQVCSTVNLNLFHVVMYRALNLESPFRRHELALHSCIVEIALFMPPLWIQSSMTS